MIVFLLSHQIILCRNATGNLSFLCRKETIFIYFTVISFVVYEKEQNWPPRTTPHQFLSEIWAIAFSVENNRLRKKDFDRLLQIFSTVLGFMPILSVYFQFDGVTRDKKIILVNYRLFTIEFFYFFRKKLTSFGRSYTSAFALIKMNKERF